MSRLAKAQGFTLIELMITIAIVAILTALALPSFQNFIRRNAVASEANLLIGSLQTARTLALSGNFEAGVCTAKPFPGPVPVGGICQGGTENRYNAGTAVFTKANLNSGIEVPVNYVEEVIGNPVLIIPSESAEARVTFDRLGRLKMPGAFANLGGVEFSVCHSGVSTANVRGVSIFVSRSGRITSVRAPVGDPCEPVAVRSSY